MLVEEKRLEQYFQGLRLCLTALAFSYKALSDSQKKSQRSWSCTTAWCLGYSMCKVIAVRGKHLLITWHSDGKCGVLSC